MDKLDYGLSDPKMVLMKDGNVFLAGQIQAPMDPPATTSQTNGLRMMAAGPSSTALLAGSALLGTIATAGDVNVAQVSLNQGPTRYLKAFDGNDSSYATAVDPNTATGLTDSDPKRAFKPDVPLVAGRPARIQGKVNMGAERRGPVSFTIELVNDSGAVVDSLQAQTESTLLRKATLGFDLVLPKEKAIAGAHLRFSSIKDKDGNEIVAGKTFQCKPSFQQPPPMTVKLVRVKYVYMDGTTRKVEWVGKTDPNEFTTATSAAEAYIKSYYPTAIAPTIVTPVNDAFFICSEDFKDENGNPMTSVGQGNYWDPAYGNPPALNLTQSNQAWGDVLTFAAEWVTQATSPVGISGQKPANTFVAMLVPRVAGHTYLVNGGNARGVGTSGNHFILYLYNEGEVIAHELGHAHGRDHVQWPTTGNVPAAPFDSAFPYNNGSIGVEGWDPSSGAKSTGTYTDIMSYGTPRWISDYTFYWLWKYDFDMWPGKPH